MGATITMPEAGRRRWKRVLTIMGWASVALWTGACGFIIYMAPIRSAPDAATGRVHGWANHGGYVYLSWCEDLVVKGAMALAAVLFVIVAVVERRLDPWQRRLR